jgi:hypothetical protein
VHNQSTPSLPILERKTMQPPSRVKKKIVKETKKEEKTQGQVCK